MVVGLIFHSGTGTLSSFGWRDIAAICPLGALETFLASKTILPHTVIAFLCMAVGVILLGKVFCAWLCPIPPLRRFLTPKKKAKSVEADKDTDDSKTKTKEALLAEAVEAKVLSESTEADKADKDNKKKAASKKLTKEELAELKDRPCAKDCTSNTQCVSCSQRRSRVDSRHLVLGGALVSSAIFGFPVFCLVCPVGLTFATIIALWRFVGFSELTLSLLVFPAILLIEILVLRKWCHKFCPLGATMSLLALPNRFFKPVVDHKKCLRARGGNCTICADICGEHLDPHYSYARNECSKCGLCVEKCPVNAIKFVFMPKNIPYDKLEAERQQALEEFEEEQLVLTQEEKKTDS